MIDEKKLIEEIHKYFKEKIYDNPSGCIVRGILTLNKEICGIVNSQPKLNMVPVTKCKDCYYFEEHKGVYTGEPLGYGECHRYLGLLFSVDDFCSYGERKESGRSIYQDSKGKS